VKIRAVTVGAPLRAPLDVEMVAAAGIAARGVAEALTGGGYEVQTRRLATPPLDAAVDGPAAAGANLPGDSAGRALRLAAELDQAAPAAGFGYVALGAVDTTPGLAGGTGAGAPAGPGTAWERVLEVVPEIIGSTAAIFCAASVANRARGINLAAARACGELVARIGAQSADGFGNLRFAALANCPPHIPFFPAAYHDGAERLTLGLALEAADLVVEAFEGAPDLDQARRRLVDRLVAEVKRVAQLAGGALAGQSGVTFTGVDLSPAPFPADDRSIARAFERLGVPVFGASGTLFVASFLTDCLQRAWEQVRDVAGESEGHRFGFSGLMLPVLEDSALARQAAAGTFGVDSLLLYAAVCGLGLDTVPLPGDTPPEELGAIILDMAALAVRLDKPLTARLFPVPGKQAGDAVSWDFAFFAPSRVLPVRGIGPAGALAATGAYNPLSRSPRLA
jgi:uncharacterized protein (UPF0210 family)